MHGGPDHKQVGWISLRCGREKEMKEEIGRGRGDKGI